MAWRSTFTSAAISLSVNIDRQVWPWQGTVFFQKKKAADRVHFSVSRVWLKGVVIVAPVAGYNDDILPFVAAQ